MTPKEQARAARRLLLESLRPYRRRMVVVAALAALQIAGGLLIPLIIGRAVEEITAANPSGVALAAVAHAVVGLVLAAGFAVQGNIAGRLALRVERDLRDRVYRHLHELDPQALHERPTGELVSLVTADLIPISVALGLGISSLAWSALTLVGSAVVMFILQPTLAALALIPAPLTILAIVRYQRTSRPVIMAARQRVAELAGLAQENIAGAQLVRASAREEHELRRFRAASDRVLRENLDANRRLSLYTPTVNVLPAIGSAIVVIVGGLLAIRGDISVVTFAVFYTYLVMLVPAMRTLGSQVGSFQNALACAARVADVLARPREVAHAEEGLPPGPAAVALDEVTVEAPDGRVVIDGVELSVKPGRTIAIVGRTGSGKTVLLRLLNRLIRPAAGDVRVAGQSVEELGLRELRSAIASAGSDDFLFAGTIADNIAYGRPEASTVEVEDAARRAQAAGFIDELPERYETELGERGAGLSGGQRQRVALARAILTRPRVLALDNATGNLDPITEAAAVEELHDLRETEGTTQIVVGYRPILLRAADEVIVLDRGRVTARGTHEELLASSEEYRELVGAHE